MSSITMPMRIITRFTISRMTTGLSETENTSDFASPGMSSKIRNRLTMSTMKTITITTPMVTEASRMPVPEVPPVEPLVDEETDRNCIDDGDPRCLGRGHDPAIDASQDEGGHEERRERAPRPDAELPSEALRPLGQPEVRRR